MAEIFAVAAGGLSVVGLAGQVVAGVKFLHGFYREIREAPAEIQTLLHHLDVLQIIVGDIEGQPREGDGDQSARTGCRSSLQSCLGAVHGLNELIRQCGFVKGETRSKRLWKQIRVAAKGADFASCLKKLESAKCSLTLAQASETRLIGKSILTTTRSSSQTADEIQTITTETRDDVKEVLENQRVTRAALEKLLLGSDVVQVAIRREISSSILHTIEDLNERTGVRRTGTADARFLGDPPVDRGSPFAKQQSTGPLLLEPCQSTPEEDDSTSSTGEAGSPRPSAKSHQNRFTWRRYNYWFGSVTLRTQESTTQEFDGQTGMLSRQKRVQRTHTFLNPCSWLLSTGAMVTVTHMSTGYCKPSLSYELEAVNIVPSNAPIIRACRNHDIAKVRQLFLEGKASPSDRSPSDWNLVQYATLDVSHHSQGPEKVVQLTRYLLECGVKVDRPTSIVTTRGGRTDAGPELTRLIIDAATENPFESYGGMPLTPHGLDQCFADTSWPVDWAELALAHTTYFKEDVGPRRVSKLFSLATQAFQPGHLDHEDYILGETLAVLQAFSKEDLWTSGLEYLVMLLKQGANPFTLPAPLNPIWAAHSPTDIARARGLLDVWEKALDEASYGGKALIRNEGYEGVEALFGGLQYEGWECQGCWYCGRPGATCLGGECGCCVFRTNHGTVHCPGHEKREANLRARREERRAKPRSVLSRIFAVAVEVLSSVV